MDNKLLLVMIGLGLLAFGGAVMTHTPRGIRNNNPGNIKKGQKWVGLAPEQTDPVFDQFISPEYGIRALYRLLLTYRNRHGLNTISGIIRRYAPASENKTQDYINNLATRLNVGQDEPLALSDYNQLIKAIILHENGKQPYTDEQIQAGMALA